MRLSDELAAAAGMGVGPVNPALAVLASLPSGTDAVVEIRREIRSLVNQLGAPRLFAYSMYPSVIHYTNSAYPRRSDAIFVVIPTQVGDLSPWSMPFGYQQSMDFLCARQDLSVLIGGLRNKYLICNCSTNKCWAYLLQTLYIEIHGDEEAYEYDGSLVCWVK